jgi:hypothetical protein
LWDFLTAGEWTKTGFVTFPSERWNLYDAFAGTKLCTFENSSRGTIVYGDDGTMFVYILNGGNNWLTMWNSTKAFHGNGFIMRRGHMNPVPGTYDWRKGIEWNVTVPDVPGSPSISGIFSDIILAKAGHTIAPGGWADASATYVGYSTTTGEQLWVENITIPGGWPTLALGEGIFAIHSNALQNFHGYDIYTGQKLWESDPMEYPWGAYIRSPTIAYGTLYSGSFDGHIYAFDITNGKLLWKYYSGDSGKETPTGSWPTYYGPIIADGVVFMGNGEQSPTDPLWRGAKLHAVDAYTGEAVWNVSGWMRVGAVVEGYLLAYNDYDCRVYCFGKGPSKTTVTVSPKHAVTEICARVTIEGTVTDESPGTKSSFQTARFPDGVPAIADEDQSGWMEYLYMQKPCPTEVSGVPVKLEAIYEDGRVFNIGTVTSNGYGTYSKVWKPSLLGEYTIVATFEGSDSYWPSYGATELGVVSKLRSTGAEMTPPETIEPQAPAFALTTETAIIVAALIMAVAVIVGVWIIRKQK